MTSGVAARVQRAPVWPVVSLGVLLVVALALALLARSAGGWVYPALGYALGALGAAALLPIYRLLARSRQGRTFRRSPGLDRLALALACAAFAVGLGCAFLLATELAK